MGFFSKIGKGIKKVFKGIGKVFKKVFGAIGKAFNSKLGKAIMLVAGVVTMGTALAAGYSAYSAAATAGESFLTSLSAGASGFMSSLTGGAIGSGNKYVGAAGDAAKAAQSVSQTNKVAETAKQAENVVGQAGEAGDLLEKASNAQKGITDAVGKAGSEALSSGSKGLPPVTESQAIPGAGSTGEASSLLGQTSNAQNSLASPGSEGLAPVVESQATPGAGASNFGTTQAVPPGSTFEPMAPGTVPDKGAGGGGGLLSKAMDFAKSDGGGNIIGKVVQGYSEGRMQEEQAKEELKRRRRLDQQWADYKWDNDQFRVDLGPGWRQRSQRASTGFRGMSRIDPTTVRDATTAGGY